MYSIESHAYQSIVPTGLLSFALLVFLVLAAVSDGLYRRIPNRLVLGGLIFALSFQCLFHGAAGGVAALAGMLTGFSLLLPFYMLGGMAAGDVKLMTMVGAFLGAQETFYALVASFLIGGVWAVIVLTYRKGWKKALLRPLQMPTRHAAGRWLGGPQAADSGAVELGGIRSAVGHLPYGVVIALGTLTEQALFWLFGGA